MFILSLLCTLVFSLTDLQSQAVEKAGNHLLYTTEIVEVTIAGVPREVVILGEMHKKTKAASELGEAVITQFKYRGIEMPPINDINASYIQAALIGFAVAVDRSIGAIRKWIGLEKGATSVLDTMYSGFFITQENQVVFNGYLVGMLRADGFYYDETRVKKLIPQLPSDKTELFFTLLKKHTDRALDARTKVDSGFLNIKSINPFPSHPKLITKDFSDSLTLGLEFGDLKHFSSRNERMAKNIIAFLEQYPEATEMLVIVGALHVSPVRKLLLGN